MFPEAILELRWLLYFWIPYPLRNDKRSGIRELPRAPCRVQSAQKNVLDKLGLDNRTQAALYAVEHEIVNIEIIP